jgi:hypothetical protein
MDATAKAAWVGRLRAWIAEQRRARPIPDAQALGGLELQQYRVHGGFMQTWLRQHGPGMLRERAVLLEHQGRASPDPVIVAHGDAPMLAAMRVLVGEPALAGEGRVVALLDDEYEAFVAANPEGNDEDREFDFHVSTWSRFAPAGSALLERAEALGKPIDAAGVYLDHVNGTLWGPRCGLEVENLWRWDGTALHLIEEAIAHVRY